MCRPKTDPNEKKHYNANETKHGVTDLIPLAVFIACVVVGFVVGIIGMNAGNNIGKYKKILNLFSSNRFKTHQKS